MDRQGKAPRRADLRARVTGSTRCEGDVRGRLACFYDWCAQNDDIAELLTLARTISKWEDEIVAAVLTRVTNARSEALNRLAKLEVRMAYSFRNPANQRRRVRIARAGTHACSSSSGMSGGTPGTAASALGCRSFLRMKASEATAAIAAAVAQAGSV
jgi:hypothetical protein